MLWSNTLQSRSESQTHTGVSRLDWLGTVEKAKLAKPNQPIHTFNSVTSDHLLGLLWQSGAGRNSSGQSVVVITPPLAIFLPSALGWIKTTQYGSYSLRFYRQMKWLQYNTVIQISKKIRNPSLIPFVQKIATFVYTVETEEAKFVSLYKCTYIYRYMYVQVSIRYRYSETEPYVYMHIYTHMKNTLD